jgi:hypothetical protein
MVGSGIPSTTSLCRAASRIARPRSDCASSSASFHVQLRYVAFDARLHHFEQAFIERDAANRCQRGLQHGLLDRAESNAQILCDGGIDSNRCTALLVRIDRHELHVHEWRFARLVEAHIRAHGVVPIENLATIGAGGLGCMLGRARSSEPVAGREPDHQHGEACDEQFHSHVVHGVTCSGWCRCSGPR